MIWLNPSAWIAVAAVAVPVLIHILVQRRAERFPFPTLRFIQPTRLAAIRRHVLEDVLLLAIRAATVAAAVAAVAAPLVVTPGRRAEWNHRLVRAVVVDNAPARPSDVAPPADVAIPSEVARQPSAPAFRTQTFSTTSLPDGIHRAVAWLDAAPPARRELMIVSPLTLGAVNDADIAAIPTEIGIRFERVGTLPRSRDVAVAPVLAQANTDIGPALHERTVTLAGTQTIVHEASSGQSAAWPIEVIAPPAARRAMDAAVAAVLSQRIAAPAPERRARLFVIDRSGASQAAIAAAPIHTGWIADAVAQIARDPELQSAAAQIPNGSAGIHFAAAPWHTLATAADGRPLVAAAASSSTLVVASAADPNDLVTPVLLRSVARSLGLVSDIRRAEVVPVPESQVRAWTRSPGTVSSPRLDTVDRDDRRWIWTVVLMLLAAEAWMRRTRRVAVETIRQEAARVA